MPDWVKDEDLWEKAKAKAAEEGHADEYDYITGIYKKMGGEIGSAEAMAKFKEVFDKALKAGDFRGGGEKHKGAIKECEDCASAAHVASRQAHRASKQASDSETHRKASGLHDAAMAMHRQAMAKRKALDDDDEAETHETYMDAHRALSAEHTTKANAFEQDEKAKATSARAAKEKLALDCAMRSIVPSLDDVLMYMPAGVHAITPSQNGKAVEVTVVVDAQSAEALETQRKRLEAGGKKPFFSIQHDTEIAAFWPTEFFWDKRIDATGSFVEGVWARGEWTKSGREAVEGKDFRTFSPTFFVDAIRNTEDKPAKIICEEAARPNMGALENDPAFQKISPLWARRAGVPANNQRKVAMETDTQETLAELQARNQKLEKDILALQAKDDAVSKADLRAAQAELKEIKAQIALTQANEKNTALEAAETKRKEEGAESAVQAMVASGAIPVRDTELQATYKAKFIADPTLIPLMASKGLAGNGTATARIAQQGGERRVERRSIQGGADINGALRAISELSAKSGKGSDMALKFEAARDIGDLWARELRAMVAKGAVFELKAAVAADTLGTLAGTLVAQRTLDLYKFEFPMLDSITTDFSDAAAMFNQTTTTRIIVVPAVLSYSATIGADGRPAGYVIATPANTVDAPITLDKHRAVDIMFDANVLASTQRRLFEEQGPAAAYALGKDVVDSLYAVITGANFTTNAPFSVVATSYGRPTFSKAKRILNLKGAPFTNRFALSSSVYQEQLEQDPTLVSLAVFQKPEIITDSELPMISKFRPLEAPNLPATDVGGKVLQAFFAHKSALLLQARIPNDWSAVLGSGSSYGSVNVVTNPDTGLSVLMVQFANPQSAHAEFRLALMYGVAKGNEKGGQIVTD